MNIWIVARAFPPLSDIGVERPKKISRYLVASGRSVTVFTIEHQDLENLTTYDGAIVRRSGQLFQNYLGRGGHRKNNAFNRLLYFVTRVLTFVFDDSGWAWMPFLGKDLNDALSTADRKPDVIIATGRPFMTFVTVAKFCKAQDIPFILDYRDAWANNPHASFGSPLRTYLLTHLERRLNNAAAAILTVSKGTGRALTTPKTPSILYNFPDSAYAAEIMSVEEKPMLPPRTTALRLGYAGTLYRGRDLDSVAEALSRMPKASRALIEVHYCGSSSSRAIASFKNHKVEENLVDHGMLSKLESTRLIGDCDIALSVICSNSAADNSAMRGVITTKVFDYLLMQKGVLNIVPPGYEFSDLMEHLQVEGLATYSPDDVRGIESYLVEKLTSKRLARSSNTPPSQSQLLNAWGRQMELFEATLQSLLSTSKL